MYRTLHISIEKQTEANKRSHAGLYNIMSSRTTTTRSHFFNMRDCTICAKAPKHDLAIPRRLIIAHKQSPEVGVVTEDADKVGWSTILLYLSSLWSLVSPSQRRSLVVEVDLTAVRLQQSPPNVYPHFTGTLQHIHSPLVKPARGCTTASAIQSERRGPAVRWAWNWGLLFYTLLHWQAPTRLKCPLSSRRGASEEVISQRGIGNHRVNGALH